MTGPTMPGQTEGAHGWRNGPSPRRRAWVREEGSPPLRDGAGDPAEAGLMGTEGRRMKADVGKMRMLVRWAMGRVVVR